MSSRGFNTLPPGQRLILRVDHRENGCWLYPVTGGHLYGRLRVNGKQVQAHRFSYEQDVGPIPEGMMVCHRCDTPACVNPDHLFLGSAQDNMTDKINKGRHRGAKAGASHHLAKLSERDVDIIRARLSGKENQYKLAKEFGVSQALISKINSGQRWNQA